MGEWLSIAKSWLKSSALIPKVIEKTPTPSDFVTHVGHSCEYGTQEILQLHLWIECLNGLSILNQPVW